MFVVKFLSQISNRDSSLTGILPATRITVIENFNGTVRNESSYLKVVKLLLLLVKILILHENVNY